MTKEGQKHTADECREAFEKWAAEQGYDLKRDGSTYQMSYAHLAWMTWQAARAETGQAKTSEVVNRSADIDFNLSKNGKDCNLLTIRYPTETRWSRVALHLCIRDSEFLALATSVVSGIQLQADFGGEAAKGLLQRIHRTLGEQRKIDVACGAAKAPSPDTRAETGLVEELAEALESLTEYVQQQAAQHNLEWALLEKNQVLVRSLNALARYRAGKEGV